jgi:hypothetical protein
MISYCNGQGWPLPHFCTGYRVLSYINQVIYFAVKGVPWKARSGSAGQEIYRFYGTRNFPTMFTISQHQTIFWATWIHSIPSDHICLRSILISSSHLCLSLPNDLFTLMFSDYNVSISHHPCVLHVSQTYYWYVILVTNCITQNSTWSIGCCHQQWG